MAEIAAVMIAKQLDLFGATPKPPKKIREDEEIPVQEAPTEPQPDNNVSVILPTPAAIPTEEQEMAEDEGEPEGLEEIIALEEAEKAAIEEEPAFEQELENEPSPTTIHASAPPSQQRGRKPINEYEDEIENLQVPPDEELFKRQYYSMRETAAMFTVNQSLLRFWENEFDILEPKKNKKGDRYFRPADIKNLVLIYHLLRVRKFTLEGAKEYLQKNKKAGNSFELIQKMEKIKSFLLELKANL